MMLIDSRFSSGGRLIVFVAFPSSHGVFGKVFSKSTPIHDVLSWIAEMEQKSFVALPPVTSTFQ